MNFYFIALIPIFIGGIIWIFNRHVNWVEWAAGSAIAFIGALIFHLIAIHSMTSDIETWSGQIIQAKHYSKWLEYYEYAVYRTEYYTVSVSNSNGKGTHTEMRSRQVFDHWQPTQQFHNDSWSCNSDLLTSYDIDEGKYFYFTQKYKMNEPTTGDRSVFFHHNSHMISGDPNDYYCTPQITHWVEPVTITKEFVNKIKAAPSVFSFVKVSTNIPVYEWPQNPNPFVSDRVLGTARQYISTLQLDQLNGKLGPRKKVNLIIVGFDSTDSMLGQYQRAKWIGGKKNDLVITVGGHDLHKPDWCFVFGWTDSDVCKQTISSWIMDNGLGATNLFEFLNQEIMENYQIKKWKDFDYLKVEPAPCYYWYFILFLIITQTALYWFFMTNGVDKSEAELSIEQGQFWRTKPILAAPAVAQRATQIWTMPHLPNKTFKKTYRHKYK
jgi:hypothetical protein